MSYIWKNYRHDKEFYVPEYFCPYVEVLSDDETKVPVNPLLRFSDIFNPLYSDVVTKIFKLDLCSFNNVLFHYLAQIDRSFGMNYFQMIIEKIRYELLHGYYGEEIIDLWKSFKNEDQEQILYVMAKKMLNDSMNYFSESVNRIFKSHILTYDAAEDVYFLYISAINNNYNCIKLKLIRLLFWSRNCKMTVVWEYCYGVISMNNTMRIDYIQIV